MKQQKINYSPSTPLPNNFLAEQSILNILLTTPPLIKKTVDLLKIDSFYFEPHKIIYSLLCELEAKNVVISLTNLVTELQDKALLEEIGGIERIVTIVNRFESFVSLEHYIGLVNEKYLRRLIIELGKQSILLGYTTSSKTDEILKKVEEMLFNLNQQNLPQKFHTSLEVVDEVFFEMTSKIQNNKASGFSSNFNDLDSLIQGFQKSDLIIVAGRPSMGKTAFALNLGENIVKKYKIPAIIFSLEMTRQQIIYRILSTTSQINATRLKSGKMSEKEWKLLTKSMEEVAELPIYIDDNSNLTINDIRAKLRNILPGKDKDGKKGEAVVIIDYLQLMRTNLKLENRMTEISYITRSLKILAKEFEVPIILLSQLSRAVELRPNKRPLLSDLRESGSIEQDADIVIMIYRDDYYSNPTAPSTKSITELIVAKHRNGPIGTARVNFNSSTTSFTNI